MSISRQWPLLAVAALVVLIGGCSPAAPAARSPLPAQSTASVPATRSVKPEADVGLAWPMLGHDGARTGRSGSTGRPARRLAWSVKLGGNLQQSPIVGPDGTVYLSRSDGQLYAVAPTGKLRWAHSFPDYIDVSPAIGPDGTIYVGCGDFKLYAITPAGRVKWTCKTGNWPAGSAAIGRDGTIYVVSGGGRSPDHLDSALYAIDQAGHLKWSYVVIGTHGTDPAVDLSGTVYFGSYSGRLYAIDQRGRLKWSFQIGSPAMSPAIDSSGTVYFGSEDSKLYAVGPDGRLKWSHDMERGFAGSSPAIGSDGTIYASAVAGTREADAAGTLFAFAPDGHVRWSRRIPRLNDSSPAIGGDGTLYVGTSQVVMALAPLPGPQGGLCEVDPHGRLRWSYAISGIVRGPPAIGSAGTVYVDTLDGWLYAFTN